MATSRSSMPPGTATATSTLQHAEFLYSCVQETVKEYLPGKVADLGSHDQFVGRVQTVFDISNNRLDLLWRFLQQSDGRLSKRERVNEFAARTNQEAETIEKMFREAVALGQPDS